MFLSLAAANAVAVVPAASAETTAQATPLRGGLPPPSGRLKFKSAGPVCMCGDGLSEQDIERAATRAKAEKSAGADPGTSRGQAGGQEKNLNLGDSK